MRGGREGVVGAGRRGCAARTAEANCAYADADYGDRQVDQLVLLSSVAITLRALILSESELDPIRQGGSARLREPHALAHRIGEGDV